MGFRSPVFSDCLLSCVFHLFLLREPEGALVGVFYWYELRGSYSITGRFLWDERLRLDSF